MRRLRSLRGSRSAIAAFYTTVLEGLAIQARDGETRQGLQRIIEAAMVAWEPLTNPR